MTQLPYVLVFSPDLCDICVQANGVLALLQNIKTSKSVGLDNVTSILLKTFTICIAGCLTKILTYSLASGVLSDVWKLAKLIPIYKKGNRCQSSNYRPVSLTSIACKLLEHIIAKHIHFFLDKMIS